MDVFSTGLLWLDLYCSYDIRLNWVLKFQSTCRSRIYITIVNRATVSSTKKWKLRTKISNINLNFLKPANFQNCKKVIFYFWTFFRKFKILWVTKLFTQTTLSIILMSISPKCQQNSSRYMIAFSGFNSLV